MTTGRPSKLTALVQKKLCKALADGNTRADACILAGVGLSTVKRWLADGKAQKRGQYRDFRAAVQAAEAKAAAYFVKKVKSAASKHFQAAIWWLERRRPREFGRRAEVSHTSPPGRPVKIEHDARDLEAYRAALQEFARSVLAGPAGGAVPADDPQQPLDTPPAPPQAGAVPPPR